MAAEDRREGAERKRNRELQGPSVRDRQRKHWERRRERRRAPLGKWLKRYHMLHHHDLPGTRYGITSPLWDLVFGTYVPTRPSAKRETARRR